MVEKVETLLIFAYTAWAIYSGYKVLTGRSEWLDRKAPLNMAVKIVLSVGAGYVIGGLYLIYLILKFLVLMARM